MKDAHPVAPDGPGRKPQIGAYEPNVAAFVALMAIALIHLITVWGHGAAYWGDQGRWLHEVDRFATGEVVYRDFHWAFPPLSMWLLGTYARVFGSDLTSIWIATSAIFMGIALLHYFYIAHLVERRLVLPTAVAGLVFAITFANISGVPLPQGMYSPAAPVGFLFLLGGILLTFRMLQRPSIGLGIALGVACAACILTKQDYWPPAVYLLAVSIGLTLWNGLNAGRHVVVASTLAAFLVSIAIGAGLIVVQSGTDTLLGVLSGFGHVAEYGGTGLPSWERFTTEVVACALLVGGLIVTLCIGGAISRSEATRPLVLTSVVALAGLILYVWMGFRIASSADKTVLLPQVGRFVAEVTQEGVPLLRPLLWFLRGRLVLHLLPALLPGIVLLVLLAGWQRFYLRPLFRPLVLLLGLCFATRLRRLSAGVEWYHFLLELPAYVLVVQFFLTEQVERVRTSLAAFLALLMFTVGGYTHWNSGRGPLTRRANWEGVLTPQGKYYMPPNQANDYRLLLSQLLQIDPTGKRPLFAFGYTGGFNYLLGRPNPTPLTQGFRLSSADPAAVVDSLMNQRPRPILLDNAMYAFDTVSARTPEWFRWETPEVPGPFVRFDRMFFNNVLRHCTPAGQVPNERPYLRIYDCGR